MNGHQIDELLKRKVDNARRGRTLRTAAAVLALLALIALIGLAIHRHNAKAVNEPEEPSAVETEDEPAPEEPEEPPAQTQTKPLQPEEMRRSQIKHELVFEWRGVPEEEMPSSVTVSVVHQGEEVARFTLTEENEWRHSWSDAFEGDTLTLRADLPKSVMASFVLRGNQFTMTGSYGTAVAPATAAPATEDGEAPEDTEGEAPDAAGGEAPEDTAQEAEVQSGTSGEAPETAAVEQTGEEESDPEEMSDSPRSGHRWWPIVLLMLLGAALVTLGMLGIDRRRSR